MKVTNVIISTLKPYKNNSRVHSDEQVSQIAASIKEFGFTNPVLIDENKGVIAGHGRVKAAKLLKFKAVPCVVLEGLSDTQKQAYVIADNKLAMNATWDDELLELELDALRESDFDLSLLGFDENEIDLLSNPELEDLPGDSNYTKTIKPPIYEMTQDTKPSLTSLLISDKTKKLLASIKASKVSKKDKEFLIQAAYRHTVFDYEQIAEFYAHSSAEMQELMEQSALVIIDFNKALEGGYVALSDEMAQQYTDEDED